MKKVLMFFLIVLLCLALAYVNSALWFRLWLHHGWFGCPELLLKLFPADGEDAYDLIINEMFIICFVLNLIIAPIFMLLKKRKILLKKEQATGEEGTTIRRIPPPKKTVKIFILISMTCILTLSIIILALKSSEFPFGPGHRVENARREISKQAEYAIIGEILKESKVYLIEKEKLGELVPSIEFKIRGAVACGYDYYIKIYRKKLPNLYIHVNTKCDYFTISDKSKSYDFGFPSNFFVFSGRFREIVQGYIKKLNESKKYIYVVKSPISNNLEDLKRNLIQNEGFKVLKPDAAPEELNPYLRLNYVDRASKYPNLNEEQIWSFHDFGKFEPDNIFNEIINHEYLKDKIALISGVAHTASVSDPNDYFFSRQVKVFLQGELPIKHFQQLKNVWLKNNNNTIHENLKFEIEFIRDNFFLLEVISDRLLETEQSDRLVKEYKLKEIYSR